MQRTTTLALLAAALTTTCVPVARVTPGASPGDVPGAVPGGQHEEGPGFLTHGDPGARTDRQGAADSAHERDALDDGDSRLDRVEPATPVVLVVLDGVRWQEVFNGVDPALAASHHVGPVVGARALLPSLYAALDARGAAVGAPGHGVIEASGPNFVSLPGYTEIFGGHPPVECQDNDCAGAGGPTIVDAIRDRVDRDADVAVIASWPPIGRAATQRPTRIVLSAGRQDVTGAAVLNDDPSMRAALDEGARANPRPGHDAFRPDRYTAALALRYLETRQPAFLFVGLGEPDEYAHADDYRGYLASLRAADDFFGRLFAVLDRMGERGRRSLVLVTADHGRARDYRDHGGALPESARVWLMALGGPIHARGFVEAPRERHLADVAPTIRQVGGLPFEGGPRSGTPMVELLGDPRPELVSQD